MLPSLTALLLSEMRSPLGLESIHKITASSSGHGSRISSARKQPEKANRINEVS